MKKFFSALILSSLLMISLVPLVTSAQVAAPECCKLKRAYKEVSASCTAKTWVGSQAASDNRAKFCPKAEKAGETVTIVDEWAMCCLFNTIYSAVDWIFTVLIVIVVIFALIGGITILTAAGESEKITKGKDYILWAFIGLIVAFLAKAVPGIIKMIMGI